MDLFVAQTLGFDLLFAFVIVRLNPSEVVCINITGNSTTPREYLRIGRAIALPSNQHSDHQ